MRRLHVTNGDATVPGLRGTGLTEPILVWRDALPEGPVPDVPLDELRRIRAAFLAGRSAASAEAVATQLEQRDHMLAEHRDGDYVLWFEADLYDQLQLVEILARLAELDVGPRRITLICVGEHVGIARFGGLGELTSEQLGRLPDRSAATLSDAALALAVEAWAALRAPEPSALTTIAAARSPELRFVGEAFDRLGREYPSTRDGLALTERRLLAAVAQGAPTAGAAFVRAAAREARPFLGDTWAYDRIARLSRAPTPLLADITSMQLLCMRLGELERQGRGTLGIASLAKLHTAAAARRVCGLARDVLGGNGILLEYQVARHHADVEATYTYEGTDSIQSLIVGREITGLSAFVGAPSPGGG